MLPLARALPGCWRWSVLRRGLGSGALALCLLGAGAQPAATASCPPTAQPLSDEQLAAGMRAARDRGFLWRITRDGHSSYLYGTLHIARLQWMFPGPQTVQALAAADTVALELDLLDPDIGQRLAASMRADPAMQLPEPLAARLRAQVEAACLAQPLMARLDPTVQLAALTTLAARWEGLDPTFAIDTFLAGRGRALGKIVVSLESPEQQIALLKGDPATSLAALDHGLAQLEGGTVRPMLVRISQVWDEGREDELSRYEAWCECVDTEADRAALKRLLDDRNPALAERIDALHAAGNRVFAAVGSLHMVGPIGLPQLMSGRGYAVQRLDLAR